MIKIWRYKRICKFFDISLALIILSLVILGFEFRYKTNYLFALAVIIGFIGGAIGPNWYRALWDKNYCRNYSPRKDMDMVFLSLFSILLIAGALILYFVLGTFVYSVLLLGISLVLIVYVFIFFLQEDYELSQHITDQKHSLIWFFLGVLFFLVFAIFRYWIFA